MSDFNIALKRTLVFEGGYSDDPADPGGITNYGITENTATLHGYMGDMHDIPMDIVKDIYLKGYWGPLQCGSLLDQDLANQVFDFGVNSGTSVSAKTLQRSLVNVGLNDVVVDGVIGPETLGQANLYPKQDLLVSMFKDTRSGWYRALCEDKPNLSKFLAGWLRRAQALNGS